MPEKFAVFDLLSVGRLYKFVIPAKAGATKINF